MVNSLVNIYLFQLEPTALVVFLGIRLEIFPIITTALLRSTVRRKSNDIPMAKRRRNSNMPKRLCFKCKYRIYWDSRILKFSFNFCPLVFRIPEKLALLATSRVSFQWATESPPVSLAFYITNCFSLKLPHLALHTLLVLTSLEKQFPYGKSHELWKSVRDFAIPGAKRQASSTQIP